MRTLVPDLQGVLDEDAQRGAGVAVLDCRDGRWATVWATVSGSAVHSRSTS